MLSYDQNPDPDPTLFPPDAHSTPPREPESSLGSIDVDGSLMAEGDYTGYETDFFRGVPGLQTPPLSGLVDPSDSLRIPTIEMPEWEHLSEQEQAEMDDDPDANKEAFTEDMLDELDEESPIPKPSCRHALHPQGRLAPIRLPPPAEEEQVAGGYRRREATPPKHLPSTRLRAAIVPTARAVGNSKASAIRRHRENSTREQETSFSSPPAPPSTPPPRPDQRRPPPPPPPNRGRAASDEPRDRPVAQVRAEATPRTEHRAPSAEPIQPSPAPLPRFDLATLRANAPSARARHPPQKVARTGPPPSLYSGIHQPGPAPRVPCFDPPGMPPPPHSSLYQPMPIPPPPHGYVPPSHGLTVQPRPPSAPSTVQPCPPSAPSAHLLAALPPSLSAAPAHLLASPSLRSPPPTLAPVAEDPMSPFDDNDTDGTGSVGKDVGGRPSKAQMASMAGFLEDVRELADTYSLESGLPVERYLTAAACAMSKASRGGNGWNIYQGFARSAEHAVAEYQHIRPDFDLATMDLPRFSAADLSAMYKRFQEDYPDGEADAVLEKYSELQKARKTRPWRIASANLIAYAMAFGHWCIDAANEKKFESIVFICGSHVHEDSELASIIATPALETAFPVSLKHHATKDPLTASDLLAIAKICAYSAQMANFMESGVTVPEVLLEALGKSSPAKISRNPKAPAKAATVAKVAKASSPGSVDATPSLTAPSASVAGTSSAIVGRVTAAKAVANIPATTPNINLMRDRFCAMSQRCIELDFFRDKGGRIGNFLWVPLGATLAANNMRLVGYPNNVRLPGEASGDKASGAWRAHELAYFNIALLENESELGVGLRLEQHTYAKGDLVIIGHDYLVDAPGDTAAAEIHWQTSCGRPVRCQDSEGNLWSACVDLRRAGDAAITKKLTQKRQSKAPKARGKSSGPKGKGKMKAEDLSEDEEEGEEDEEDEVEVLPPARTRGKSRPAPAEEAEGGEADDDDLPPSARLRSKPASVPEATAAKTAATKPAPTTKATTKAAKKRKALPVDDSDAFFDDDELEEEEETSPPPAKKLRSMGPPTPIPPPQPQQSLAVQEGGGRKKVKQVTFTAEPTSAPANNVAAVAERRKRVRSIPPANVSPGGREFVGVMVPSGPGGQKASAAGPSGPSSAAAGPSRPSFTAAGPSGLSSAAGHLQHAPPSPSPPPQSSAMPPAPGAELVELFQQLSTVPPEQIHAILTLFRTQNAPPPR
ncbi:hypothetical protein DFH07DRAFT_983960 [Mycena maculata]|uniref:Uncharacterized protein n=1 Tax=Mycena maculata TaxID=230809 RepID=A0AAD7IB27_9AGAR|nr:hypothetical protein DFH07DRAFT_983960 [Mycena maculata]